jgi:hypothetical protein
MDVILSERSESKNLRLFFAPISTNLTKTHG